MGNVNEKVDAASTQQTPAKEEPKKLKPCCACPETKRARDAWYECMILVLYRLI
jgi:hypothetical protein